MSQTLEEKIRDQIADLADDDGLHYQYNGIPYNGNVYFVLQTILEYEPDLLGMLIDGIWGSSYFDEDGNAFEDENFRIPMNRTLVQGVHDLFKNYYLVQIVPDGMMVPSDPLNQEIVRQLSRRAQRDGSMYRLLDEGTQIAGTAERILTSRPDMLQEIIVGLLNFWAEDNIYFDYEGNPYSFNTPIRFSPLTQLIVHEFEQGFATKLNEGNRRIVNRSAPRD